MNLIFFGDLHISDRPPVGRVDDYTTTALGKLEYISRECERVGAQAAFSTGDIFHLKQPNRVSHSLVQSLIQAFKRFPCPVYVVPGNHDMGPDELESLNRQPLGVLERAGAIHLLLQPEWFEYFWVVPRPWNTNRDADPSYYSLTQEELSLIQEKRPMPIIGLAHGSIVNPGNTRPFPYVDVSDIPDIQRYGLFISGHLHENLGIYEKMYIKGETVVFANPGSVMRIARNQASYSRKVQILHVAVQSKGIQTKLIDLPIAPAVEVFGAKEPEPNGFVPNDQVQEFLEALGEGLRADKVSIEELIHQLVNIEDSVKVLVKKYLEEAM